MELASAHERPPGISYANTTQSMISSSGITFRLWRLYQHSWLVALMFPLFALLQAPRSPAHVLFGLGGLAIFAMSYTWLMWPHPVSRGALRRSQVRARVGLLIALVVLALIFSFSYGLSFLWLFIGVSACAGVILPSASAFVVVSLLMMLPVAVSLLEQGSITRVDWPLTLALVLLVRALGLDMIGVARMGHAIRELHNARRERARLAVAEERLRVARDLHDLLGHTLSMIALKSELAWRTMEQEPVQAAREIQDVEKTARQVLREVRTAVAGYRQPTLRSELEGAQQLLEAAGIEERVDVAVAEVPAVVDTVLAWVVREGVTNVVRHSRARWCSISLTEIGGWVRLVITNDDRRMSPEATEQRYPPSGNGLPGLVERVVAQGGHVEAGPRLTDGAAGFRVQVELPLPGRQEKTFPGIGATSPAESEVTS
jgi:two-component system, NarL family, sensor histidine kinase DesK